MPELVELPRKPGPPPGAQKTPGSGRKPGSRNKVTKELREVAQKYTVRALRELARLAEKSEDDAVRLKACSELLDRGHGRPAQTQLLGGADGAPMAMGITQWLAQLPADETENST